jgi:superfamily II DNA or RNA helicase
MVTLKVGNSFSKISGLDDKQYRALRQVLSYKVDYATAQYIQNPANRVKYCIDKTGNFATGLVHRVLKFLKKSKIEYVMDCVAPALMREAPTALKSEMQPYPDQINALQAISFNHRGIISLPTGCGKSFVIAMLLSKLRVPTIIVVPTVELKNQLTETLKEQLTSMKFIKVENIDSAALKDCSAYDCLIVDECHHTAAKTYHKLNKTAWSHIQYRYFFTATPFRNDTEETLLFESIAGRVIYELTYQDAVKAGYIVPVEAFYIDLPTVPTEGYTYREVYSEIVVNNESRNLTIATLLSRLYFAEKSTLCLVKEIKHGEALNALTNVPFANGGDEESRKYIKMFSSGKIRALIGTTGLCGEGCDTKPAEYVIIAGLGKAKSAFLQQIGRTVRRYEGKESAKVIIFRDSSHKWSLAHFREQKKILLDYYGIDVVKLDII